VVASLIRSDLAMVEADCPHAKSLADFFDIFNLQPTMDIEG
jgi:hypothetical protein